MGLEVGSRTCSVSVGFTEGTWDKTIDSENAGAANSTTLRLKSEIAICVPVGLHSVILIPAPRAMSFSSSRIGVGPFQTLYK